MVCARPLALHRLAKAFFAQSPNVYDEANPFLHLYVVFPWRRLMRSPRLGLIQLKEIQILPQGYVQHRRRLCPRMLRVGNLRRLALLIM